jgi:hypothetical protein
MDGRIDIGRGHPERAAGNHPAPKRSDRSAKMSRIPKIAIALLASIAPALAQNAATTPAADTSNIILAPKAAEAAAAPLPAAGAAPHAESTAINAAISSGLPAYDPVFAAPRLDTTIPDLRDIDRPRNRIPRLPLELMSRYVVREARLPVFRTVDLFTKEGLVDLSLKAHPGLRIGNIFNLNSAAAYEAALNDQKMSERQDLTDTALAMAAGGDISEAEALQDSINEDSFKAGTQAGPVGTGPAPR